MELATRTNGAPEAAIARRSPVQDDGPLAFMMDSARFEHMGRVAQSMAASVFLPQHLRGKGSGQNFEPYSPQTVAANCFRVLNQAMRWGVDPFAVCDETFVTGGKLGYSGKLIAAIVNTRAGLKGRLGYAYKGAGKDRTVTVSGTFAGQTEPCTIELSVHQGIQASDKGKGPNQMWFSDPDQKLVYSGVVKWARRYCPEVIMGVLTDDDIDAIESRRAEAEAAPAADLNAKLREAFTAPVAAVATLPGTKEIPAPDAAPEPAAEAEPVDNPAAAPEPQAAQPDAAQADADEPPADYIPDELIGTLATWRGAMKQHAEAVDMADSDFLALMKGVTVHSKVNNPRSTTAMAARREVLAAFRAGKLGADGKIQQ